MPAQTPTVPPPPPPAQVPDLGADLASLQTQLGELRVTWAGLDAQWKSLQSQLEVMLRNNPARPGVQQQWADVGVQRARVEGDIARLEARIAQRQGFRSGKFFTGAPPRAPRTPVDPNRVVSLVTVVMLVLLSTVWARRIFRGAPKAAPLPYDVTSRLERMEHAVDAIAIEVERVSEGQRFMTKVLTERPTNASSTASATPQQAQPLALGAGPMEPIVAKERDRVQQRIITPH
jgi:hypothetical protein